MKKLLALILVLAMTLSLVGCGKSSNTSSKTLSIGVFEPASGDNGAGGKQETLGMQYANSVTPTVAINGETYNVVLKIVDNQSATDKAPTAAQQLVSDNVSVVLGSYGSGVSMAAAPIFEQAKIPAIGASCTNPAVTQNRPYYFRVLHRSFPGQRHGQLCQGPVQCQEGIRSQHVGRGLWQRTCHLLCQRV
jgi:ABC-type branched-chain amino acid transport systems, periplasmic component